MYNIILILLIANIVIIKYILLCAFHMKNDRNTVLNMYAGFVKLYT
jgi:hypothetical protein